MLNRYLFAATVFLFSCTTPADNSKNSMTDSSEFIKSETQLGSPAPDASQVPHTTEIHGLKLEDPYFWMRLSDAQKENADKLIAALGFQDQVAAGDWSFVLG